MNNIDFKIENIQHIVKNGKNYYKITTYCSLEFVKIYYINDSQFDKLNELMKKQDFKLVNHIQCYYDKKSDRVTSFINL